MDQQLLTFVRVVERQSFSRAADELHISQPAVSQQINALERDLKATLLDRSNKTMQLTKAGEVVYHHAREILRLHSEMERILDEMINGERGDLSIGASYTYGEYILPHTVAKFRKIFPQVRPSIVISNSRDIEQQVASGQLDLGIIEGISVNDKINVRPFARDQLVIISSPDHPLAQRASIRAADLSAQTWTIREKGSGTREMSKALFAEYRITPAAVMEFGSTQVIKEAVEAGLGIALLSISTIRKELQIPSLRILPFPERPVSRDFVLITRQSKFTTKAMTVFEQYLRSQENLPWEATQA